MNDLPLRPAILGDEMGIAHVRVATWRTQYRGLMPEPILDALREDTSAESWRRTLQSARVGTFVAVDPAYPLHGGIVGFASGGPNRATEPPFNTFTGELYALYILEPYQQQGLGRRLFNGVVDDLRRRELESMIIFVLHNNPARAFYEKMGGQVVGESNFTLEGISLLEVGYGWKTLPDN